MTRKPEPPALREAEWQDAIAEYAMVHGWRVAHFPTSRTPSGGYATAVRYNGVGFPDLVLAHPTHRVVAFVEVKTDTGRLTPDQEVWATVIEDIEQAGRIDISTMADAEPRYLYPSAVRYFVWQPRMRDRVFAYLTNPHH